MKIEWFVPQPTRSLEWFGLLAGTLAQMRDGSIVTLASVVGPKGETGDTGDISVATINGGFF